MAKDLVRTRAQITKFYGMKCQMQVRDPKVVCPCERARVREREIVEEDHRHERGVLLGEGAAERGVVLRKGGEGGREGGKER